jgi:ABC-type glycerol-3-phosphate transport system permease component
MSQQLTVCLVAVAANLCIMLLLFSALSHALARLALRQRGVFTVIVLIGLTQWCWIAPALFIVGNRSGDHAASYALWFGNWLVAGFSLVLLWKSAARIPVALDDSARLDGLGLLAAWRQTVFPFAKGDLVILAVFTLMATLLPFWGFINLPEAGNVITIFERTSSPGERVTMMLAGSLAGAVALVAVFFAMTRRQ